MNNLKEMTKKELEQKIEQLADALYLNPGATDLEDDIAILKRELRNRKA